MARRALDYATAHPIDQDGFTIALQRLDAAVTGVTDLGMQESGGQVGQHSGVAQRRDARSRIRRQYLVRVVRIGQQAAASTPALIGLFDLPAINEPNKSFLLHARTLHQLAAEHAAALVPLGLGDAFVTELGAALDQFEKSGTAIDTGRAQHVGAAKGFQKTVAACRSIISVLDTFYRAAFAAGSPELAGWENARTVEGPFIRRHGTDIPAPAPVITPPAPLPPDGTQAKAA